MKYILRNTYRNCSYICNSYKELEDTCNKNGLNVSTVIKARRENRESLSGWELLKEEDVVDMHLSSLFGDNKDVRVLVIGDIHEPYCIDGYLEFCKDVYDKERCNEVVFIGDLIDGHSYSSHKPSNDNDGVNHELDLAISKLKRWHEVFPDAKVCLGNHEARLRVGNYKDLIIPDQVFKPFNELLEVPTWEFAHEHIIGDVKYHHGIGRTPKSEAQNDCISVVAGHRHSEGYIQYYVDSKYVMRFGMQVGSALNPASYAAAYSKGFKPQHINVGVVTKRGPRLIYMNSEDVI